MDALGDRTRRQIFELLRSGPRSVGELAADLPVSRPAVSQHLRVLEDVGLVTHRRNGTRHLYELDSSGVRVLRDWVDGFWNEALARFKSVADTKGDQMSDSLVIEVIKKTVTVDCAVEEAFRVFTSDALSWWPVESHSIAGTVSEIVFEHRPGGEVYEVSDKGERGHWASVLEWDPPHRLVLAWNILALEESPTEVEVRFSPAGSGTRVDLEHRGWDRLPEEAERKRDNYDGGWGFILERFVDRAAS